MPVHRLMPKAFNLGSHYQSTMGYILVNQSDSVIAPQPGLRRILGFNIPTFQRGLVWSSEQQISFIESAWKGIPLGTYSLNLLPDDTGNPLDGLVLDGQQRLNALERYLNDELPVHGYCWSEITDVDRRFFKTSVHFPHYEVISKDEMFLREYYDLMNFGGVDHKPEERALPAP